MIPPDAIPWIIFAALTIFFSITAPFMWGPWLVRKLAGVPAPIKGGLPGSAVIESIAETGITVTMPSVGPDAPGYKLALLVTPAAGGAPYRTEVKALVPRIFIPMIVPGAIIAVIIDPEDSRIVAPDWENLGSPSIGAGQGGRADDRRVRPGLRLERQTRHEPGCCAGRCGLLGRLSRRSRAARHSCSRPGRTARPRSPRRCRSARPRGRSTRRSIRRFATTRCGYSPLRFSSPGTRPFPAVFGHRVPLDKLATVAPGVRLSVAVDEANKHNEVAIDWTKSPLA